MANRKTVEETYQELTEIEHVLLRPDSFVGSLQKVAEELFLIERAEDDGKPFMRLQNVPLVPGALKVVDEIITNAADHAFNTAGTVNAVSKIKITVDREANSIEVWNDGAGIPVQIHDVSKCYVPEMIFGRMRTGSNYADGDQPRFTGGRNGLGGKLTNIFSKQFVVETADGVYKFRQVFSENMNQKSKPKITRCGKNYTKITFTLDFDRFDGMDGIDDFFEKLIETRAYSISAATPASVSVYYNGRVVPVKKFQDYVNLFIGGPKSGRRRFFEENADKTWSVALSTSDNGFRQVSLVNSIDTYRGGKHVDYIYGQIQNRIFEMAEKRKNLDRNMVRKNMIRDRLFIFINCRIDKPTFSSQTKEEMTLPISKFGTSMKLSTKTIDGIAKEIFDDIVQLAEYRQQKTLADKTDGTKKSRLFGITKLEDATKAGTRESQKCTLILTEGDSAASLAFGALADIGRDYYGIYPLRGKLVNVKASEKKGLENAEVNDIKQILGLRQNQRYTSEDLGKLRYGRILLMSDQDVDGLHIRGLVINVFHTWWPELLQHRGFMCSLATPIVKATRGRGHERVFYNLAEFQEWKESGEGAAGNWHIKYYKGLGTSTKDEGKEYFKNLANNMITYTWSDASNDAMELAFNKKLSNERKDWLNGFDPRKTFLNSNERFVSLDTFVNKELIGFSSYDNIRSIASVVDGLKPSTRKILFTCFNTKAASEEVKVAQLGARAAEMTSYHHGEQSLTGAIVGMAQNFVGSNNINLLKPSGQFGTRRLGGSDAASPRYIFTQLEEIAKIIYNPLDHPILNYLNDDGQQIEPEVYYPIIPMVLVNGVSGIGTGWSSDVPTFNPLDLVNALTAWIRHKDLKKLPPLAPWVRNFIGAVEGDQPPYCFRGKWERVGDTTVRVTELPPGTWIQPYKEFIESHLAEKKDAAAAKKTRFQLADYINNSSDETVDFVLEFTDAESLNKMINANTIEDDLRLRKTKTGNMSNMNLFDANGVIRHYNTPQEIIDDYAQARLQKYVERRTYYLEKWQRDYEILYWRYKFVERVTREEFSTKRRSKREISEELAHHGFPRFDDSYDYLLQMPFWSISEEKMISLEKEMAAKKARLDKLAESTPESLWLEDLDAFKKEYAAFLDAYPAEERRLSPVSETKKRRKRAGGAGKAERAPKRAKKTIDIRN